MNNLQIKLDTYTKDIVIFDWDKEIVRMWIWTAYWLSSALPKEEWSIEVFSSKQITNG